MTGSVGGGALFLVGTGPGDPAQLTLRTVDVLRSVDAVFGYTLYLDLLRPLLPDLDYRPSPITQEEERARNAVEMALAGARVALVGSGDAGIYGLAGLALELLEERGALDLPIEVVPGVTAATSAAALLGAPLGHDFCAISLSDLLTPWTTIRARLEAAAAAGFVSVLYNPASGRRRTQLAEAAHIFLGVRDASTPVGLVRNAYRSGQEVRITTLGALADEDVDMLTTVIIGNPRTRRWGDRLITPRGYRDRKRSSDAVTVKSAAMRTSSVVRPPAEGEAVLLVGHGSRDPEGVAEFESFAATLQLRLGGLVHPAFLEFNQPALAEAVRRCVHAGARRIVVMPLFLGAATHQKNDVPTAINWARSRYPGVEFVYGAPLGAHALVAEALGARALAALDADPETAPARAEAAVLLVGRGSRDPDSNAELYKVGRLLYESGRFPMVESCYVAIAQPDLPAGIERCVRLGARRIVLLPQMLFTGVLTRRMERLGRELAGRYADIRVLSARPLGDAPQIVDVVVERVAQARGGQAAANCDSCKYRVRMTGFEDEFGLPQSSDHSHGLRGTVLEPHHHDGHNRMPASVRSPLPGAGVGLDDGGGGDA